MQIELEQPWIVIPARGGSTGVPRKHIRLLAGEPLIARTIRTDEADHSSVINAEGHAIHRAERSWFAEQPATLANGKVDLQVLHFEQCHGYAFTLFCLGSNASRRPSPMKLMHSAIAMMNIPGYQNSHGRVVNESWYLEINRPSETSGGTTPKPR